MATCTMISFIFILFVQGLSCSTLKSVAGPRERLYFFSRPDLKPPKIDIDVIKRDKISPGYYFLSPWKQAYIQNGPYIHDSDGDLVWSGVQAVGGSDSHGIHPCDYSGQPHLCFYQGHQEQLGGFGHGLILDQNYRLVKEICANGGSDFHEIKLVDQGKKALLTAYEPKPYDLASFDSKFNHTQIGWIWETGFQEIDTQTNDVTFSWRAADHIHPSESVIPFSHGSGTDQGSSFDYTHINSVDKFSDSGDYLVSARHTSTIYKVSGQAGSIIWRLGGKLSNFTVNFTIDFQHHARIVSDSPAYTDISFFNNGRPNVTAPSFGTVVRLDHHRLTASALHQYIHIPPHKHNATKAEAQGSVQLIPDSGNTLVGWGSQPYITEHHRSTGDLIARITLAGGLVENYRTYKGPWIGRPRDIPATWAFAYSNHSSIRLYASWNGATEVHSLSLYGGTDPGNLSLCNNTQRTGFETLVTCDAYYPFVRADAFDKNGLHLASSRLSRPFVPGGKLKEFCNEEGCPISADWPNIENEITAPWLKFLHPNGSAHENGHAAGFLNGVCIWSSCSSFLPRLHEHMPLHSIAAMSLVVMMVGTGVVVVRIRRGRWHKIQKLQSQPEKLREP